MSKGYTLIELLATIVIMAVIFSIAIPITTSVIGYVRKESFKISVTNIGRAGDLTYSKEYVKNPTTRELIFIYNDGVETSNVVGVELDYTGKKPLFGNVVVNKAGKVAASLHNGELCATKEFSSSKVIVTEDSVDECIREMYLPQIFLVGDDEVFVEINDPYVDEFVTALTSAGEPTTNIERTVIYDGGVVTSVDTSIKGEYLVVYKVIEEDKSMTITRTVNVVDTIPPVITTPGDTTLLVDQVMTYNVMAGVSVVDNSLEAITVSASGSISRLPGSYIITYSASDSEGNLATVTRVINVNDVSAPVITLLGSNPLNIFINSPYVEAGATALDDIDLDVTLLIETSGSINTNIKGVQYVSYSVTDSSGNTSNITRTVNIIDNIPPVVTFGTNGNSVYAKTRSTTVSVTDSNSTISSLKYAWTTEIIEPSSFSTVFSNGATITTPSLVSGNYYLWVEAIDSEGNKTVSRTNVFRLDNTPPNIITPGNDTIVINQVTGYNLMTGVSVTDNSLEVLSINVTGNIARVPGNYVISYSATDSSGNNRLVTRTITVSDVESPVITLLGSNPLNIFAGGSYIEAGATALDDVDGNLTASIITSGSVNTAQVGVYLITYTVTDTSGNVSTRTRTVNVLDSNPPTIAFGLTNASTYERTRSTTVTVTDTQSGVANQYYTWTTTSTAPAASSINQAFTNGSTITTPASVTGTYYLWIKATDNAGNQGIVSSVGFNLDNTRPIITITGSANMSLALGETYTEAGATAADNISGNVTASIVRTGTVNSSVAGTYTINYNVSDSAGNAALVASRVVTVNPRTEYRYRDSYQSCETCYNSCSSEQSATPNYSCSAGCSVSGSNCNCPTSQPANSSIVYTCSTGTVVGPDCRVSASGPTYSCSSGTLSGTNCVSSYSATGRYTCPSGGTVSGSNCNQTTSFTTNCVPAAPRCCPPGYTDTGSDCRRTYAATWVYNDCNANCSRSGGTCNCSTPASGPNYSCPGGFWYNGSACFRSATQTTQYSCPATFTLVGSECTKTTTSAAGVTYSCPAGWSINGSKCNQSYACNPYSCNCSSYWGGWSTWSTTVYSASGTRQVETRLIYNL